MKLVVAVWGFKESMESESILNRGAMHAVLEEVNEEEEVEGENC